MLFFPQILSNGALDCVYLIRSSRLKNTKQTAWFPLKDILVAAVTVATGAVAAVAPQISSML